jgi:hypothetical protein
MSVAVFGDDVGGVVCGDDVGVIWRWRWWCLVVDTDNTVVFGNGGDVGGNKEKNEKEELVRERQQEVIIFCS